MRRLLLPLTIPCLLLPAVWAQGAAKLTGWTYRCESRYLGADYEDRTGRDLTDGNTDKRVIYAGGTITIDLDLGKPTEVSTVAVNVSRPNNNYRLRDWQVQAQVFGNWRALASGSGFWGPTEQRVFNLALKGLKTSTDRLRLVFNTAGLLCISEIEVAGLAAAGQGAPQVALAPVNDAAPSARQADVDGDGKPELILENSLVRLIFWPHAGGVCRSFLYKPAACELVGAGGPGYGAFRDQLWAPDYAFAERPYSFRTGGDGKTAWVELSVNGAGGMMAFTTLTKRLSLSLGSPVVSAHYKLQNEPSSQTDYTYGLWFHNFLGVPGRRNTYFTPTQQGVQEYVFESGKPVKQSDVWYQEPARGWTAVCAADGAGLAATLDYKYLYCFYHWAGSSEPTATHEWRFNRQPLKAGQALETDLALIPFQGLQRVDGVVGDLLGEIVFPGENPDTATVQLQGASALARAAEATVRVRPLPAGTWKELAHLAVSGEKPARVEVSLADLPPGGYVLNCQAARAGKVLDDFERPFSRGGLPLAYRREPLEKRVGLGPEEKSALPRHELSDAVVSPHIPWASSLPGGPLKALVLCDDFAAREVIELKQRLQLDLDYVKFRTTFWTEDLYCGDRSISTPDQANKRLQEYLAAKHYELIILSAFNWNAHFKPETRRALLEQVSKGAGLIYIEPDGLKESDELAPMLGVAKTRAYWSFGKWQPTTASPLTAALPYDLMPVTRFMDYTQPPQGQVLLTLDNGKPLLVTSQFGQGRTVALTYDTLTHEMSYRGYAGLIPIFSYRGGFLRDEYRQMTWPYWEPYYALLGRLAVWASGRETPLAMVSLPPLAMQRGETGRTLSLGLTGNTAGAEVAAQFVNRWGQPLGAPAKVPATGREIALPVPPDLPAGTNLVNVIVRNARGESLAWGETYVKVTAPVALGALQPEKTTILGSRAPRHGQLYDPAFQPAEPLRLKVALDAVAPQTGDRRLRARLSDTHGRLLFEETRPVPAEAREASFEARPDELRNAGLQWEVAVLGPQGQEDVAYARVVCVPPRDWDRFKLTSWGGIYPWRSEYTFETLAPRVADLVDVSFSGPTEMGTGKTWLNLWHNIGYSELGVLSYMGKDVADFMDDKLPEKSAKYRETKDKQYLVRQPSLSDRTWRGKVNAHVTDVAQRARQLGGAYDYCMGDEMSLTSYTQYYDFDFSPQSLAEFREWLKQRYASLGDLNTAWETTYASWDDVVPLTLDEAKQRDNAAPWCEFRDFMNDTLAGLYSDVSRGLAAVDSECHAGLSGTQEPRAGNGMDWWKNSRAFNYYHSYNTGWSNEMRRSFAPYTGVRQSPYYAGYWQAGRQIEYNMLWCLLHDTTGVSAWDTDIMFYNDYTYSEAGRDTLALCQEFKRGLWDAVRSGTRLGDGIAIHYSHDSINAAQLLAREEEQKDVRDVWVKLLEDLGLQYNFVATPQIEAGLLTHPQADFERYRVLILPESFAISAKERDEIAAFIKGGGTVIADLYAGLLDGKCRKQPQGMLDEVFGVKRGAGADTTLGVSVKLGDLAAEGLKLQVVEGLATAGATACAQGAGETRPPAVCRNLVGKGRAWYLNLDLRPYDSERTFHTPAEKQIRDLLSAIFAEAGLKAQYTVSFASGTAPNVELVRYRAGDLVYLGMLRGGGGKEELATLRLPLKRYVYDARRGESLGQTEELRLTFEPQQCRVLCLSPRPLSAPQLAVKTTALKAGEPVAYTVTLPAGAATRPQVVHLTVTGPDGRVRDDYARNLILGDKPVAAGFRLALSDEPGRWTLTARDVCGGGQAKAAFTVKDR